MLWSILKSKCSYPRFLLFGENSSREFNSHDDGGLHKRGRRGQRSPATHARRQHTCPEHLPATAGGGRPALPFARCLAEGGGGRARAGRPRVRTAPRSLCFFVICFAFLLYVYFYFFLSQILLSLIFIFFYSFLFFGLLFFVIIVNIISIIIIFAIIIIIVIIIQFSLLPHCYYY